ncbi:MAG: hypothetical protein GWO02_06965 [Gammaproteobacteria bacterium]|nr:hypothetical protein [Gammaproteobacteria bacterium]
MNPLVRIVTLLVFAAGVAHAGGPALVAAAVLVSAGFALGGRSALDGVGPMLKRLRWLALSLLVVYLWFTPGPALAPALGPWSPTWPGLAEGLARCATLVLIVLGVRLLFATTSREQLLAGLYGLARILRPLGVDPERVAVRVTLTLEAVPRLRPQMRIERAPARGWRGITGAAAETARALFATALAQGRASPLAPVALPRLGRPAWGEWLAPVALAALFGWLD